MEIYVSQFDVLVHPDWSRLIKPDRRLDTRQFQVRQSWEDRAQSLQDQPALLLYFSGLREDQLIQGLGGDTSQLNKVGKEDIERILRFQRLLNDRLILFEYLGDNKLPTKGQLKRTLDRRGFRYNPREAHLLAYGEILEWCVYRVGNYVRNNLGILFLNFDAHTSKMSISAEDPVITEYWQREAS